MLIPCRLPLLDHSRSCLSQRIDTTSVFLRVGAMLYATSWRCAIGATSISRSTGMWVMYKGQCHTHLDRTPMKSSMPVTSIPTVAHVSTNLSAPSMVAPYLCIESRDNEYRGQSTSRPRIGDNATCRLRLSTAPRAPARFLCRWSMAVCSASSPSPPSTSSNAGPIVPCRGYRYLG